MFTHISILNLIYNTQHNQAHDMDLNPIQILTTAYSRPRNQKEIRENSPIIVSSNTSRPKELYLKTSASDATTKTYHFDKVFGPDSDQQQIYNDIVAPMLDEVIHFLFHAILLLNSLFQPHLDFRFSLDTTAQSLHMVCIQ
jgi:hypothetical protein